MSGLQERIAEIDRVWNDQIQYSTYQRQQRLLQSIATFLEDHDRIVEGLHDTVRTLVDQKSRLRLHPSTDGGGPVATEDLAPATVELDELWLAVSELGLRLASAWNLRAGTRKKMQQQLRSKGLSEQTVQRMCNAPGFWEEVEARLGRRKSVRHRISNCKVSGDAQGYV